MGSKHFPAQLRAVVTGAGSGLGQAVAFALARRGARVLVTDVNAASAEKTAREVSARGGDGVPLEVDVTRPEALEAAAREADKRWGGTDLLVNNAGVAAAGAVGEVPLKDWEWIVRVNLWGVIHGCHAFVPRMKAARGGWILNVASAAGIACLPEMASYNVTKAAVIALSETLHGELYSDGVNVSVLCPTFFPTNLLETFRAPQARYRAAAEKMFSRASFTADDVAEFALRGVERGKLVLIPQLDGRLAWYLKRLAPAAYFRTVGKRHRQLTERLLSRATSQG